MAKNTRTNFTNHETDLYSILGLDKDCCESSIKYSFLEKMQELNFAKEILSCPYKKKLYDDSMKFKMNKQKSARIYPNGMNVPTGISEKYQENDGIQQLLEKGPEPMTTGNMFRNIDEGDQEEDMNFSKKYDIFQNRQQMQNLKIHPESSNNIKENFGDLLKTRYTERNVIAPFDYDTSSVDDYNEEGDDRMEEKTITTSETPDLKKKQEIRSI